MNSKTKVKPTTYIGILSKIMEKGYNHNKYLSGWIESPQVESSIYFHENSLISKNEVEEIRDNKFIIFKIVQSTHRHGRLDADECELNCEKIVIKDCLDYEISTLKFIFRYADEDLKNEIVSKIQNVESKSKIEKVLNKIKLIKQKCYRVFGLSRPVRKKEAIQISSQINKLPPITFLEHLFQANSLEYNQNLFKIVVEGIKQIDKDEIFEQCKFLLDFNQKHPIEGYEKLTNTFYQNSTKDYKFKLWLENITDYCSTDIIKSKFEEVNEKGKNAIVQRCKGNEYGFLVLEQKEMKNPDEIEEVYFSGIRQRLLEELDKAQNTITIAVAWFTNDELFGMLCKKLKDDKVKVELIIINDFINNWEHGLPFQTFVDLGGKLYFSEYPDRMHHKFCIIDDNVLFNGSYNWTYYAESNNDENVIFFKNKLDLTEEFSKEFDRLKEELKPAIETITLFENSDIIRFERVAFRSYLSKDIEFKAKFVRSKNIGHASELLNEAIKFDDNNKEANQLFQEVAPIAKIENNVQKVLATVAKNTPTLVEKENTTETPKIVESKVSSTENNGSIKKDRSKLYESRNKTTTNAPKLATSNSANTVATPKTIIPSKTSHYSPPQQKLSPSVSNNSNIVQQPQRNQQSAPQKIQVNTNFSIPETKIEKTPFTKLKIAIALDISGSMKNRYDNGTMQQVIEKVLGVAVGLANNKMLDVWVYDTKAVRLASVGQSDFQNYIKEKITSRFGINSGTQAHSVLNDIHKKYFKEGENPSNIFAIIITDGEDAKELDIRNMIQYTSNKSIFWQFIGIGANFKILEGLSTIPNQTTENVNFFSLNDFSTISEDELYNKLLKQFPLWYKEAQGKGMLH